MVSAIQNSANGAPSESAIAGALQDEVTFGYRPTLPMEALWIGGGEMPQITLRRDLEFMQMHPIVATALDYYRSGINGAEFWGGPDPSCALDQAGMPVSADPRVASFVLALVQKFWRTGMPQLQEGGYPYGWGAGEHVYREVDGLLCWSHLRDFHPHDAHILTLDYRPVGVRVRNIRGTRADGRQRNDEVDLWFAEGRVPAKAAWYAHRARFGQFYGRSQLTDAWRPWRRLGWRDAVEQVIDAAIYRAGYKGPVVKHPMEDMATAQQGVPATRVDGAGLTRRSARDVARQMVEWAKAGAGFTMSSAKYAPGQGGGDKWGLEWPDHVMDVRPLIEAARYLEEQIMLGVGVPPELVRAGGAGSGYSGRSIPRESFLTGQQRVAEAMLRPFVEGVVRPLVLWNFGAVPFDVQCKSLLATQSADKQAGQDESGKDLKRSQAAKDSWQVRKINEGQASDEPAPGPSGGTGPTDGRSPSAGGSAPMSLDPAMRERVLGIVQRVLRRRVG